MQFPASPEPLGGEEETGGEGGRGHTPSPACGLKVIAPSAPAEGGSPIPGQEGCVLSLEGARFH